MSPGEYDDPFEGDSADVDSSEADEDLEEAFELDARTEIFLEMRKQNLDLLRIAAEVAGFTGAHPPLKQGDVRTALRNIWDVYSEMYSWIDPEESESDDEEEDDDD